VLARPTFERILDHIGEPTQPPVVLPAPSPPNRRDPGGWIDGRGMARATIDGRLGEKGWFFFLSTSNFVENVMSVVSGHANRVVSYG